MGGALRESVSGVLLDRQAGRTELEAPCCKGRSTFSGRAARATLERSTLLRAACL